MNKDNIAKSSVITLKSKAIGHKDLSENGKKLKSFRFDVIKLQTFYDFMKESINTLNEKVIVVIINILKNIIKFKEEVMLNTVKKANSQDNFKEMILNESIEKEMQGFLKLVSES